MADAEVWRVIPGFDNYEASNVGRIRRSTNCKFRPNKTGKCLLPQKIPQKGYLAVWVNSGIGNRKYVYVHRLVALAWIPNPNGKLEVNHKDGNKQNNSSQNLEWCTTLENRVHAVKSDLHYSKIPRGMVGKIRERISNGDSYVTLGKEFGVDSSTIGLLARNATFKDV